MRTTGFYLGAAMVILLCGNSACGPASPSSDAARSFLRDHATSLRFALASAAINLDPRFATDAASSRIVRLIYRSLVEFDQHFQAMPGCASWQKHGVKRYRFTLLDNCGDFHNGSRLNSDDVIATYASILDSRSTSPFKQRLDIIHRMYRIDERTLDFELREDDPLFPAYLDIGLLPKRLIEQGHAFSVAPIGNGPFKLLNFEAPDKLRLQRIGDGLVLEFIHVPDPTVRMLMLLRQEVDICQNDLTPELVNFARHQPGLAVTQAPGSNFSYLGFNLRDPVLSDIRVRRAIAMSIDRQAIINSVFYGAAAEASSLLSPDHWVFDQRYDSLAFDPVQARRLLEQAGYGAAGLELSYKTSKDPFRIRLATIIQSQLAEVGIHLHIQSLDWGSFFADVKSGNFQLYSLSWVGVRTPDIYRQVFHSESLPPKGANRGYFINREVDRLLDSAQSAADLPVLRHDYSQVQRLVLNQMPYVPLWYEDHIAISNNFLTGYQIDRSGSYDSLAQVSWRE